MCVHLLGYVLTHAFDAGFQSIESARRELDAEPLARGSLQDKEDATFRRRAHIGLENIVNVSLVEAILPAYGGVLGRRVL